MQNNIRKSLSLYHYHTRGVNAPTPLAIWAPYLTQLVWCHVYMELAFKWQMMKPFKSIIFWIHRYCALSDRRQVCTSWLQHLVLCDQYGCCVEHRARRELGVGGVCQLILHRATNWTTLRLQYDVDKWCIISHTNRQSGAIGCSILFINFNTCPKMTMQSTKSAVLEVIGDENKSNELGVSSRSPYSNNHVLFFSVQEQWQQ